MDDRSFDESLVTAAFALAAERGWPEVSVVRAARRADLKLDRARGRFAGKRDILARFGRIADQAALASSTSEGAVRDRLFDLLMRRFDTLQAHRGGVLALKTWLPREPGLVLGLAAAHGLSMAFMLEAAGLSASGLRGTLRTQGLIAVWLQAARAWENDESPDMSATMAALDSALDRAARVERWMGWAQDPADPGTAESPRDEPFEGPPDSPPSADPPASPPI